MNMTDAGLGSVLLTTVARNWPLVLIRGVAAIAFGVICLVWPAISLLALVLLWGIYALVDGVNAIVWGASSRWWSMVVVGVVSVLAGLIAFFWPAITALALLYLIAAWAIVRGVVEIAAAVRLRHEIENEWLLGLGGIASLALGVLIAVFPGAGALSVVWLIGVFAVVFGALAVGLALRLRSLKRTVKPPHEEAPVGTGAATRPWDEDTR
jgi:uncharacterized membrane protein HdeD (DUF308 family)